VARSHVRFVLNRKGIAACAVGPELKQAVHDIAEHRAKPFAEAISEQFRDTGEYAESFTVNDTVTAEITRRWPMLRAAAELANTSGHALIVEVGTAATNGAGHRVLRKTLQHLDATSGEHQ
jgi:hypothetical protein